MRLFGTVDTFVESAGTSPKIGRLVANLGFLRALLRHGTFDGYHLFCSSRAEQRQLAEALPALAPDPAARARVQLLHQLDLPAALEDHRYAAFHVGGWSRYLPALAHLRARVGRPFPLSGIIHTLSTPDVPARVRQLLEAPLGACDAILCTSEAGREAFRRHVELAGRRPRAGAAPGAAFAGRLELVPLGVADEAFAPGDRRRARAALGVPRDALVLLWIGRLSAASKADLAPLLYALRLLLDRAAHRREVRLVLAGAADASNLAALREGARELRLADCVRIEPDVAEEAKRDLLAAADVFVSPVDNHQETFGLSIVEAMAAGLPVVASDFDGYRDLVAPGETGLLVPTLWARPPEALAALRGILAPDVAQLALSQAVAVEPLALVEALARLAADPELRRSMGEAGRRRARERFAWSAIVPRLEALWAELAASADGLGVPPSPGDPDVVDPFDVFGHYPSALLEPGVSLALGPVGEAVLAGSLPMPAPYADLAGIFDGALTTALVRALAERPRSAGELEALAAQGLGAAASHVRYLVLWLLKYGVAVRRA